MIKKHIPVLVVGLLIVLVALAGGAVYGINTTARMQTVRLR